MSAVPTPNSRAIGAEPLPSRIGKCTTVNSNEPLIERVTSPEDVSAVAQLEALCFTNPWTREMLERELRESPVARVYALREQGGGVAAFCSCWIVLDELHVNTIAVAPHRRREGLGTRLMLHVMREAAEAGATRATLEVRASNTAARRLYSSLGFVETAVRQGYYTQPEEDGIILWRGALSRG
jgi:[ribosomal protein S18]-alanine N-acetyltransferase